MTFAVETIYNTEADGSPVPEDVPEDEMPRTFHGPFDTLEEAISWMENDYPDGDTDVYEQYANDYPDEVFNGYLNDPKSIFGDIPDDDIRDDVAEVPC